MNMILFIKCEVILLYTYYAKERDPKRLKKLLFNC